jgi:serpin B
MQTRPSIRSVFTASLLVAAAAAATAACNGGAPVPPGEQQRSALTRAAPASLDSADVAAASAGNTAFAIDLYNALRRTSAGNSFYSPWSISSALAMTYAGAAGDTATEMAGALHFTLPPARLHAAFNAIDQSVTADAAHPAQGSAVTFRSANALFAQTGKVFSPAFLDTLATQYGAGVSMLDFTRSPEPSRAAINSWVSDLTEGHIPELLGAGSITSDTRVVLTNAVYFHAAWQHAFEPRDTRAAPFHRADGTDVTVPMMSEEATLRYAVADGYRAVEVPYANRDMTLLVVAPTAGTLGAFEGALDPAQLAAITAALHSGRVALSMPRFTMRSTFHLRDVLGGLGMVRAFADGADFSGMDGARDVVITDVVHQAWVDVSEAGTEAAAATGVIGGATSVEVNEPIALDHPFVFFIRDNPSGAILFAGRVLDPTATN